MHIQNYVLDRLQSIEYQIIVEESENGQYLTYAHYLLVVASQPDQLNYYLSRIHKSERRSYRHKRLFIVPEFFYALINNGTYFVVYKICFFLDIRKAKFCSKTYLFK